MSNPTAAKVAAAAARHAVAKPTTDNLAAAHSLLQDAKRAGATDAELRDAGINARR
jgi:hypothetical protein